MPTRIWICLCTALAAGLSPAHGSERNDPVTVVVPPGASLSIDGTWSEGEWRHAARVSNGDLQIRASHAEGYLQIGVRAPSLGVASICIVQGQRVYVLHASAALGRAVYRNRGEHWELDEGFEWRVRTTALDAEAAAERETHRDEHGWVASTSRMGTRGEVEFQIASTYLNGEGTRLAVGVLQLGDGAMTILGWPFGADQDGSTQHAVIAGPLPEKANFHVEGWVTVTLAEERTAD